MGGHNKIIYISGQIINGLVFVREVNPRVKKNGGRERRGAFTCFCGSVFEADIYSVKSGNAKSCGCFRKRLQTKHGLSRHPIYFVWRNMKRRCMDKKDPAYKNYGGRGITICKEWIDNPKHFIEWAENNGYNKSLVLDRIDNDGNYEPENCRFVSTAVNNQNTRATKLDWGKVEEIREAKGVTEKQLAEQYGVSKSVIHNILANKRWKQNKNKEK